MKPRKPNESLNPQYEAPASSSAAAERLATITAPAISIPLARPLWMALRDCCRTISEDRPTARRHREPLFKATTGIGRLLANSSADPLTITRGWDGWRRLVNILANYGDDLNRPAWAAFRAIHQSVIDAQSSRSNRSG
jgi:hypothetical protein